MSLEASLQLTSLYFIFSVGSIARNTCISLNDTYISNKEVTGLCLESFSRVAMSLSDRANGIFASTVCRTETHFNENVKFYFTPKYSDFIK